MGVYGAPRASDWCETTGQRGLFAWAAAAGGTWACVPCVRMSVCAMASKHQAGLAVGRTKDWGPRYLSGCDPGLDTEETRRSRSWLLEEPGGPSQLLGRAQCLALGYQWDLRSGPATRETSMCVSTWGNREISGSRGQLLGKLSLAAGLPECLSWATGGIHLYFFSINGLLSWLARRGNRMKLLVLCLPVLCFLYVYICNVCLVGIRACPWYGWTPGHRAAAASVGLPDWTNPNMREVLWIPAP